MKMKETEYICVIRADENKTVNACLWICVCVFMYVCACVRKKKILWEKYRNCKEAD